MSSLFVYTYSVDNLRTVYIQFLGEIYESILCAVMSYSLSDFTIFVLGIFTVLDLFHWKGFKVWKLSEWINDNEKKRFSDQIESVISKNNNSTKELLSYIYEHEHNFLRSYEEERISLLLKQLRISASDFDNVRNKIIKLRTMPSCTVPERTSKITKICTCRDLVLVDQSALPRRKYPHVRYYLNFLDVVAEENLCYDIAVMMADCIYQVIPQQEFINRKIKIVIPVHGNLIFGKSVASVIGCQFIKMRSESFITDGRYWENKFLEADEVVVLNDVLVTSDQIIESISKFPGRNSVVGMFFAVSRTDISPARPKSGKTILEEARYQVYSLVELSDADIDTEINR